MNIIDSGILVWGLTYPICAIIKPDIIGMLTPEQSRIALFAVGGSILSGFLLRDKPIGKVILFIMGIAEAIGGVASWSGITQWNVPFTDKTSFNISMGIMDLLSSVAMITKSLEGIK